MSPNTYSVSAESEVSVSHGISVSSPPREFRMWQVAYRQKCASSNAAYKFHVNA